MHVPTAPRLEEILLEEGHVTPDQLQLALLEQKSTGENLAWILRKFGFIRIDDFTEAVVRRLSDPFLDVTFYQIHPEFLVLFPPEHCLKHQFLPMDMVEDVLVIAYTGEISEEIRSELENKTGCEIQYVLTSMSALDRLLGHRTRVQSPTVAPEPASQEKPEDFLGLGRSAGPDSDADTDTKVGLEPASA